LPKLRNAAFKLRRIFMSAGFSHVALKQLNDITERRRAALTRLLITVPCSNPTPADRLTDVVPKITSSP
jgi:hypothetical protein